MTKTNNKGFSLVELIIVIAIMAVLIGVLAPQFIKYVEKSRVSSDGTTTTEFETAMQTIASDPDIDLVSTKSYKVSNSGAAISITDDLKALFDSTGIIDTTKTFKYQSTAYKNASVSVELKYNSTSKVWEVKTTGLPDTSSSSSSPTT